MYQWARRLLRIGGAAAGTAFIIAPREERDMNDGNCPITSLADAPALGAGMQGMRSWIATPLVRLIHRFRLGMAETHDRSRLDSLTERLVTDWVCR
jgi:hypothetical protein